MFDPVMDRLQMEAHDYQAPNLQSFSSFKDVYLVDFLKLPLKSTNDYNDAFDIVLQTSMGEYLSNDVVLTPADWPGQLFFMANSLPESQTSNCNQHCTSLLTALLLIRCALSFPL